MRIYVPTRGRISNQLTVKNLPASLRKNLTIVCPSHEVQWHTRNFPTCIIMSQPDDHMGISEKRAWIVQQTHGERIVMLDDDLRFAVRREDDPGLFRPATDADIEKAFQELDAVLDEETPHAGFSARGGGISDAAKKGGWQMGKRMMYVLGYHVPTVRKHAVFGRLSTHEDMDVCLQLLTKGFPNLVNYTFVVDQKFGSAGGCTNERTIEKSNEDCRKLAEFFPGYVRITEKEYKSSVPRLEVVCSWVKALNDGLQQR